MILGIGTDMIEIERIERAAAKETFLEKYFTPQERVLFAQRHGRTETIAGNFAAKEAVAKALGTGFSGFSSKEIEILRDERRCPYVILHGGALERGDMLGVQKIHVSISHCQTYATAIAVAEGGEI